MAGMSSIDKDLLRIVQDSFPLTSKPWAEIADKLGMSEDEVLVRVKRLSSKGIIKRIGPILDARKVGLNASTLVAMKVPRQRIDEVARKINEFENVTHNYQRDHEYNLWFTLTAKDDASLRNTLKKIVNVTKVKDILNLPTLRIFKIDVRFDFK